MKLAKFLEFKPIGDDRGSLISLEANRNVPFPIRRVYYIFGTKPNVERGFHAHHKLSQIVVCMSGSCTFVLDDGFRREEVVLDNCVKALVIDRLLWREMKNFSSDCVLMVLASDYYDESDYIRKYDDFLKIVQSRGEPIGIGI